MKKTSIILTAALAGAVIFTGCHKDPKVTDVLPAGTVTTVPEGKVIGEGSVIVPQGTSPTFKSLTVNYNLYATQNKQAMIQWTEATASPSMVLLHADVVTGKTSAPVDFAAPIQKSTSLLSPVLLGSSQIPQGGYNNVMMSVQFAPGNVDGMQFTGAYKNSKVLLSIRENMTLRGKMAKPILLGNALYEATMVIDANNMLNGITPAMLDNAENINGNIEISPLHNSALYRVIVNNIAGTQMAVAMNQPS